MDHKDELQDQQQIDENLEPVEEQLEGHEESDAGKWEKVFSMIDDLTKRLDGFEKWVNEAIGGIDRTESDEAEDTAATSGDYEEDEVADLDKSFYERQKQYLREGGY
jgi:hypothetical protein